jgi:hypothetical protein
MADVILEARRAGAVRTLANVCARKAEISRVNKRNGGDDGDRTGDLRRDGPRARQRARRISFHFHLVARMVRRHFLDCYSTFLTARLRHRNRACGTQAGRQPNRRCRALRSRHLRCWRFVHSYCFDSGECEPGKHSIHTGDALALCTESLLQTNCFQTRLKQRDCEIILLCS